MTILRHIKPISAALLLSGLLAMAVHASNQSGEVVLLDIDGPIGPATADYVVRGIETANDDNAQLIILRMDTPGGLDTSMRDMIKSILASDVPVAGFVAPGGSRAASAGTYLLYASHVAAMAPATNLGAATPVQIGGMPGGEQPENPAEGGDEAARKATQPPADAHERKAINDAVAYIRGLATKRGRNADWAESAVRDATSLPAEDALAQNVIDLMAKDVRSLLEAVDGLAVETESGTVTLATSNAEVRNIEPDWRSDLLSTITDPTIAYLLMLIGIYGLIFEGYNPGAFAPGVIGAICLLLALFAFQVLPINHAGLALIFLGVVLMIAEAFAPSFGALGLGGIVAFVIGSIILMDTDVEEFQVSLTLIGVLGSVSGVLMLATIGFAVGSMRRRIVSGKEEMIGLEGTALNDIDGKGAVFVHSERWNATSKTGIKKDQRIRVVGINGLVLEVEPVNADRPTNDKENAS